MRIDVPAQLPRICGDMALGLDRSVRLRAFGVREPLVNPLLDIDDLNDERWPEILQQTAFIVSSVRSLQAVHILSHKLSPEQVRRDWYEGFRLEVISAGRCRSDRCDVCTATRPEEPKERRPSGRPAHRGMLAASSARIPRYNNPKTPSYACADQTHDDQSPGQINRRFSHRT